MEFAGKIKVAKVNVDENPELPAQYGVRGIPALFMFKGGEVISNRTGAAPKASLKGWIDWASERRERPRRRKLRPHSTGRGLFRRQVASALV